MHSVSQTLFLEALQRIIVWDVRCERHEQQIFLPLSGDSDNLSQVFFQSQGASHGPAMLEPFWYWIMHGYIALTMQQILSPQQH
jgi:hypothetical protein